jgi:hypothetical protein
MRPDTDDNESSIVIGASITILEFYECFGIARLAAPQGFEPQYADSESAVLPLNEGAVRRRLRRICVLTEYIGRAVFGQ